LSFTGHAFCKQGVDSERLVSHGEDPHGIFPVRQIGAPPAFIILPQRFHVRYLGANPGTQSKLAAQDRQFAFLAPD
jgi:hypothetical protein